jgi:gliding motility-associated-like protein
MTRFLIVTLLLVSLFNINSFAAGFTANGGSTGKPYAIQPPASSGLDKVFIFNGKHDASVSFETVSPGNWIWHKFVSDPSVSTVVDPADVSVNATATTIVNVDLNCGYFLQNNDGLRHYVYLTGYTPIALRDIQFLDEGDKCSQVTIKVNADEPELCYYNASGIKRNIQRTFSVSWNTSVWNQDNEIYESKEVSDKIEDISINWSTQAPLSDTYFTVSGDQFAEFFGIEKSVKSQLYKAVAVKAYPKAVMKERTAQNEIDKSTGELTGSAPLDISFKSNPSDAVKLVEWLIYKPNDTAGNYLRFTDVDLDYSFKEFGKYTVKLIVSNASCTDSALFYPQVSEFFLDCPNFFTPRSTPGENDEFRVAYRSVVTFKGVIVNRWGNVMFEWNDPAIGWDGKYKGKHVSPGVYFYVIEATGSDGKKHTFRGDINLLE